MAQTSSFVRQSCNISAADSDTLALDHHLIRTEIGIWNLINSNLAWTQKQGGFHLYPNSPKRVSFSPLYARSLKTVACTIIQVLSLPQP